MQVLQPQGLFTNKPLRKPLLDKHCFYTSPAFKQKRFYIHKTCFYTRPAFSQTLSLQKHCFYTKTFLHKTSFHTNAVFTQALSLHKRRFYTSPAFTQWHFAHRSLLQLANGQQAGWRRNRNAEGCQYTLNILYIYIHYIFIVYIYIPTRYWLCIYCIHCIHCIHHHNTINHPHTTGGEEPIHYHNTTNHPHTTRGGNPILPPPIGVGAGTDAYIHTVSLEYVYAYYLFIQCSYTKVSHQTALNKSSWWVCCCPHPKTRRPSI